MSKVRIPKPVADAIEIVWNTYKKETSKVFHIPKHMVLTNWSEIRENYVGGV